MISLPHVKKPCKDCPFRKDSLKGWLGKERMADILNYESFVYHKKTDKQCAGHMIIKSNANGFVNLANRFNIELNLSGDELVFDSEEECIDHHSGAYDYDL